MRIRIPLALPTEPRDASSDKDALVKNAYIDQDPSATYVVKRPGFTVGEEGITTGTDRGIFVNPNDPSGGTFSSDVPDTLVWYIDGSVPGLGGGLSYFYMNISCYSPETTYNLGDAARDCPDPTPYYPQEDDVFGITPTGDPQSTFKWTPVPPDEWFSPDPETTMARRSSNGGASLGITETLEQCLVNYQPLTGGRTCVVTTSEGVKYGFSDDPEELAPGVLNPKFG